MTDRYPLSVRALHTLFAGMRRSRVIAHSLGRMSGALGNGRRDPDRRELSLMTRAMEGPARNAACPSPGLSRAPMKTMGQDTRSEHEHSGSPQAAAINKKNGRSLPPRPHRDRACRDRPAKERQCGHALGRAAQLYLGKALRRPFRTPGRRVSTNSPRTGRNPFETLFRA